MATYLAPGKIGTKGYLAPNATPPSSLATPVRVDFTASYAIQGVVMEGPSKVTSVTVSPSTVSVSGGQTQQFNAVVTVTDPNANTGVAWSASAGSINLLGLFTAPAATAADQLILVRATSTQDTTKWAEATVTVAALPVLTGDTEQPTIPGTLTISDVSTTGFVVKWQEGFDNVAVTGYDISVDTGTAAFSTHGSTLTATIVDLLPSTRYTVRVRAFDAAGNKSVALTTQVTTATPVDLTEPVWPANSSVSINNITDSTFVATWPAALDNTGVTGYEVSLDTGEPNYIAVGLVRTKPYTGLLSGTTYNVRVRAVDATGNRSFPITGNAVTTGVAPIGEAVAGVPKLKDSPTVLTLSTLSATPVTIPYKFGSGQELILFNNTSNTALATLKGSAAGAVTAKGLAGVTIDLSGGLPISVPPKEFMTLKLDNADSYLRGVVTLTSTTSGAIFAVMLNQAASL